MSKFKNVAIGELVIDDRYQRPLDERRIERMARNYDEHLFGVLDVSERNGKLAVFDGQHRLKLAEAIGRAKVPCMVHQSLSAEREAELFVALQRERKGITSVERFKARLFSADELAVAINADVEAAGFGVRQAGARAGLVYAIQAVSSLERVYRRGNLRETLELLHELWGGDDKSTDGGLIEGLSSVIEGYGHRLEGAPLERLRETPPVVVLRRAIGHSGGGSMKGGLIAGELRRIAGLSGRPRGKS